MLDEWDWSEHFAPQPETERYLNHVADKFDLRRDIQFSSRVDAAHYHDQAQGLGDHAGRWQPATVRAIWSRRSGRSRRRPMPRIEGRDDFKGEAYHTGLWPKHPVTFEGKRVAVIGTGATGVQTIQEVAKTAGHLTVFQRRPNWCKPLHNAPISKQEMEEIRAGYPESSSAAESSAACFIHTPDPRGTFEVSAEERGRSGSSSTTRRGSACGRAISGTC